MVLKNDNLYYIGGAVRDEILNIPSLDIDYCFEGNAIEFAKNLNIIKTNPDFGTVRVLINNEEIDIASTREEKYPRAGHLPIVCNIGCDLKKDLSRRDFTINAIAKNTVTGELVDYFNGLDDINKKELNVLHENSFIDDPSRIIRGLKFSIRLNFNLGKKTRILQDNYLKNVNYDISYHRIKKELKETFSINNMEVLNRFINQKIYKLLGENAVAPKNYNNIADLIKKYSPNFAYMIYLALFDLKNFELTTEERFIVDEYSKIKSLSANNDYEIYKMFNNIPLESVLAYALSKDIDIVNRYLTNLKDIQIEITGEDLKTLGIKQGKIYKDIFDFILKEKIKNPKLSKKEEIELVKKMFNN